MRKNFRNLFSKNNNNFQGAGNRLGDALPATATSAVIVEGCVDVGVEDEVRSASDSASAMTPSSEPKMKVKVKKIVRAGKLVSAVGPTGALNSIDGPIVIGNINPELLAKLNPTRNRPSAEMVEVVIEVDDIESKADAIDACVPVGGVNRMTGGIFLGSSESRLSGSN